MNVGIDRIKEDNSHGDRALQVPASSPAGACVAPRVGSTYSVSLEPLEPGVPDIPAVALTLSGAGSRGVASGGAGAAHTYRLVAPISAQVGGGAQRAPQV